MEIREVMAVSEGLAILEALEGLEALLAVQVPAMRKMGIFGRQAIM